MVTGLNGAAAQDIDPGHQTRQFQIEGVLQDQQVIAHRGVLDADVLIGLLQLVVGLADVQLQLAQLVAIELPLPLQHGPCGLNPGGAGKVQEGVVQLQAGGADVAGLVEVGTPVGGDIEGSPRLKQGPQVQVAVADGGGVVRTDLAGAAAGDRTDPRPVGAKGRLEFIEGGRDPLPLGEELRVVFEAQGKGLEQAQALNDSFLELLGRRKAQGCRGSGFPRLQRLAGCPIGLQQAAGNRGRDGFPWWNPLGVGGDQGIKDPQLLIQGPPAALELLHLGGAGFDVGLPECQRVAKARQRQAAGQAQNSACRSEAQRPGEVVMQSAESGQNRLSPASCRYVAATAATAPAGLGWSERPQPSRRLPGGGRRGPGALGVVLAGADRGERSGRVPLSR